MAVPATERATIRSDSHAPRPGSQRVPAPQFSHPSRPSRKNGQRSAQKTSQNLRSPQLAARRGNQRRAHIPNFLPLRQLPPAPRAGDPRCHPRPTFTALLLLAGLLPLTPAQPGRPRTICTSAASSAAARSAGRPEIRGRACVRRCPAGYQDNGGYCRLRTCSADRDAAGSHRRLVEMAEERPSWRPAGVLDDLPGRSLLDHETVAHEHAGVGGAHHARAWERRGFSGERAPSGACPPRRQLADDAQDLPDELGIERRGRLVEQHHLRCIASARAMATRAASVPRRAGRDRRRPSRASRPCRGAGRRGPGPRPAPGRAR